MIAKGENYELYNADCLKILKEIEDKSVDMILCDLPYGVTAKNKWDTIIPLNDYIILDNKHIEKEDYYLLQQLNGLTKKEIDLIWKREKIDGLWTYYNRIIKDNGAIVLFGQDKFTAETMLSNKRNHRYNLIWKKVLPSGFLNANRMPLREHEDIMVFYKKLPTYNPQKVKGKPCHSKGKVVGEMNDKQLQNNNYGDFKCVETKGDMKFPTSILEFPKPHPSTTVHPTQKPVELLEWLIKTYTNEGELILDNCMGSGSTGVACLNTKRRFIGIELEEDYFNIARERLNEKEGYCEFKKYKCYI